MTPHADAHSSGNKCLRTCPKPLAELMMLDKLSFMAAEYTALRCSGKRQESTSSMLETDLMIVGRVFFIALHSIIKTRNDYALLQKNVSRERHTVVFDAMKDALPNLLHSNRDFCWLLHDLSPKQRWELYLSVDKRKPELIDYEIDSQTLSETLRYPLMNLKTEEHRKIFNQQLRFSFNVTKRSTNTLSLLEYLQNHLLSNDYDPLKVQKVFHICKALESGDEKKTDSCVE